MALGLDSWQPARVMPTQIGLHVFVEARPQKLDGGLRPIGVKLTYRVALYQCVMAAWPGHDMGYRPAVGSLF
jgi:hypothetical protein